MIYRSTAIVKWPIRWLWSTIATIAVQRKIRCQWTASLLTIGFVFGLYLSGLLLSRYFAWLVGYGWWFANGHGHAGGSCAGSGGVVPCYDLYYGGIEGVAATQRPTVICTFQLSRSQIAGCSDDLKFSLICSVLPICGVSLKRFGFCFC